MRTLQSKIKSPAELTLFLNKNPKIRKNLAFTNGVFDLLHSGHVTYLESARRLGGTLVVALNTDASVKKLKGPARPINPLKDRLKVLAALESVDFVTWFKEQIPLKTILALRPGILVKGGDYTIDQIVGAKEVLGWGGKVKQLEFVEGKSTTRIIEIMQQSLLL